MTKLVIKQSEGVTEYCSDSVVTKLYEILHAGVSTSMSELKGTIHVSKAYRSYVEYITDHDISKEDGVQKFHITATSYIIPFEDSAMLSYLNNLGVGSNGTITEAQAAAATVVANSQNTTVTKFNELKYFTQITHSGDSWDSSNSNSAGCRFRGWTNLRSVDISNFTYIGRKNYETDDSFRECTSLKTVIASNKLKKIGGKAFMGCSNLETITGLSGVILIRNNAFNGCSKLLDGSFAQATIEFVDSGDTFSSMGGLQFSGCTTLNNISISTNETNIPQQCFYGCTNLQSIGATTSQLHQIQKLAFCQCSSLHFTNADWSHLSVLGQQCFQQSGISGKQVFSHVSTLQNAVFQQTGSIQYVDFTGSTFISAGEAMFKLSSQLKGVKFPDTLKSLGPECFYYNNHLKYVYIPYQGSITITSTSFRYFPSEAKIYVDDSKVSAYQSDSTWTDQVSASQIKPLSDFATDFPDE